MKEERILNALGQINEDYIADASPAKDSIRSASRIGRWIRVACLMLLAAGVLIAAAVIGGRKRQSQPDPAPSGGESVYERLRQKGLDAKTVEDPSVIAALEIPYISREEAVNILSQASAILDCTVEEISRIKVPEPERGRTWYITVMTLSVNSVLPGSCGETSFRTVNVTISNASDTAADFITYPDLVDCREKTRAAFTLAKRANEDEVWKIGSAKIAVRELGDYSVAACMRYDGEILHYLDYGIPLTELR